MQRIDTENEGSTFYFSCSMEKPAVKEDDAALIPVFYGGAKDYVITPKSPSTPRCMT